MTIDRLKYFGLLLTVVGCILLFFSVKIGTSFAHIWLEGQGGIADTSAYQIIQETYISIFVVGGGILFGSGLLTVILAFYKMLEVKK